MTTAAWEYGFSVLKLIKQLLRSRMRTKNLYNAPLTGIEGEKIVNLSIR